MIVTELFEIDGISYTKTYSDMGMMIHGGSPEGDYSEAIEPTEYGRTYTETNTPIDDDADADEIVSILTGETE